MKPLPVIRLMLTHLLIPLLLFLGSRDLGWWQAWLFSAMLLAAGLGGRWLAERKHPGLLKERQRTRFEDTSDVKPWDKILAPLLGVSLSFPLVIVAGLDHRTEWSPVFPPWTSVIGFAIIAAGYTLGVWALVENRFFSSMVRIQTDRGHVVCNSGPYKFIRHPGYAGNILALPGIVLALTSLWVIIPAAAALVIAVVRTALEDRTLQNELPGYQEYARRVRFRLIPGIY